MDDGMDATRKGSTAIRVYCLPVEREVIALAASEVGLSTSTYLRRLGLDYKPRSMIELDAIDTMLTVSADAGRLGGLLKMFLTDDQRLKKFAPNDVRPLIQKALEKIGETQHEIRVIAETVLKARA